MSEQENNIILKALPKILEQLLNMQKISTKHEASKLGVNERTFRDNFNKIIKPILGDELCFSRSDNYWYLAGESHINSSLISCEELVYIRKLELLSEKYHIIFHNMKKMFEKYKEMSSDTIYKRHTQEILDDKGLAKYKKIQQAILDNSVLLCVYKGKRRTIHPIKIISLEGYWYVGVYELYEDGKNSYRNYILVNMNDIAISDKKFKPYGRALDKKLDNAINAFFKPENESVLVVLEMEERYVDYFKRKKISKAQRIAKFNAGNWRLSVEVSDIMEILPTVQQFLPYIKVIEPRELQKEILKNMRIYYLESTGNNICLS